MALVSPAAHSGPPLAASQRNSRARTLRSPLASVTRAALSGPCPSPRIRSRLRTPVFGFPSSLGEGETHQTIEGDTMNQSNNSSRASANAPHDALVVAGMFTVPVLIGLWIVNRMRHPQRGFLNAPCYRQRGIRARAVGIEHRPHAVGPNGREFDARNLHKHFPSRRRLLGLAPLDTQRTTLREAYGGSCSSHGPSGSSGCPSIRSSG